MRPSTRKYLASGQFIHDDIMLRCSGVVQEFYNLWREDRKIDPGVLAWPSTDVPADDGQMINSVVRMQLPPEREKHKDLLRKLAARISPYGIFVFWQEPKRVVAILETPKGTRTWTIPIERSADILVLGKTQTKDNEDSLGLVGKHK